MREDPNPDKPVNEKTFQGDNFVRKSGDYLAWQELQLHALQAYEKGADLNVMVSFEVVLDGAGTSSPNAEPATPAQPVGAG
jgi:hypothetical protein